MVLRIGILGRSRASRQRVVGEQLFFGEDDIELMEAWLARR